MRWKRAGLGCVASDTIYELSAVHRDIKGFMCFVLGGVS